MFTRLIGTLCLFTCVSCTPRERPEGQADAGATEIGGQAGQGGAGGEGGFAGTGASFPGGSSGAGGIGGNGGTSAGGASGSGSVDPGMIRWLHSNWQHNCVVFSTGALRCWGANGSGQLGYDNVDNVGDGTKRSIAEAGNVAVAGLVHDVTLGDFHTCALLADRTVRCWGDGRDGRLGYDSVESLSTLTGPSITQLPAVAVGAPVKALAAGSAHTCALTEGGTVRCWGKSNRGQLGYGSVESVGDGTGPTIVEAGDVPLGGSAQAIAAGQETTCALLETGAVRCWGWTYGHDQLLFVGDGTGPSIIDAGDLPLGEKAEMVSVGGGQICALLEGGSVFCWGDGSRGKLGYDSISNVGDGDTTIAEAGPVPVGEPARSVVCGTNHTCALLDSSKVRCWGWGAEGRLGHGSDFNIGDGAGTTIEQAGDVNLQGDATQLSAGFKHTCALMSAGFIRCWGDGLPLGYNSLADKGDEPGEMPTPGVPVK